MSAFYDLASLVLVPSGYKAQKVYAQKPLTTDGQLTFSRASTATRVNSAGLIETVSSNVPRLDYLGSTCPKLQLEPQRTNALLSSEDWTTNWSGSNRSVTANDIVSPDGYQNADKLSATGGSAYYAQVRTTASGANTFSVFLKYGDKTTQSIYAYSSGSYFAQAAFNLQTGTVASTASGTAKIEDYGNGWYRCSVSGTAGSSTIEVGIEGIGVGTYTYAWGAQLEAGAYATSYIPTLGAAVTRGADAASKTGISSLIGQTEGTLFIDVVPSDLSSLARYISIEAAAGVGSGWIGIFASGSNTFRFYGDGWDFNASTQVRGTRYKVAMAYKNGELTSAYINGTSVGTLTANTTGKSYANLKLANAAIGNFGCSDFFQSIIFPTALSNAQLAELTAL